MMTRCVLNRQHAPADLNDTAGGIIVNVRRQATLTKKGFLNWRLMRFMLH